MADYGTVKLNTVTYKNASDADTNFNFKTDVVSATSPTFTTDITLKDSAPVKFQDNHSNAYTVGIKAPAAVTASYTLTLPAAVGASGKVLKTSDGAGALTWGDVSDTTYSAGAGLTLSSTTFTLDLTKDQTWTGSQRGAIETEALTGSDDTRTLTLDFATGNNFYVDLVGSVTTVAFSNATAGQSGSIIIKQSVGSKTIAGWNAAFDWGTKTAPTITATQNKFDRIDYFIYSATQIHVIHSGGYDG